MPATSARAGNMASMSSPDPEEQQIIDSWHVNAAPWARAIRAADIASRKLVTDQAIVDAVSSVSCTVDSLIAALPWYLDRPGYLLVQTLHPVAACGELPYRDGWRDGNWSGFSSDFNQPAPWYFRTLKTWRRLLPRCGFEILECREPKAAGAVTPASVIWICKARRSAQT
jgi:hypothetical protein